MVFKWTLYELCICILRYDFDQSDKVFKTQCSIIEDDVSRLAYFQSHKNNDWLAYVISSEHDQ